jgi:hypothetical protein
MDYGKTMGMIEKLMTNADSLRYGCASVTVKKHDGRVVQVIYSSQENIRETVAVKEEENT